MLTGDSNNEEMSYEDHLLEAHNHITRDDLLGFALVTIHDSKEGKEFSESNIEQRVKDYDLRMSKHFVNRKEDRDRYKNMIIYISLISAMEEMKEEMK